MRVRRWVQAIGESLTVTVGEAVAELLLEELTAFDLRLASEVCGGSAEFAHRLGYPWPRRNVT